MSTLGAGLLAIIAAGMVVLAIKLAKSVCDKEKMKMNYLKNEGLEILRTKVRSIKSWRLLFALVLVAPLAALSSVGPTPLALAQGGSGGVKGHTFNVTFTKWITSQPANPPSVAGVSMLGVVGGAVGEGRFAGYVYSDDLSVPGLEVIHARYEFYGEEHSFVADIYAESNNPATAVITGVVTQGWLKGAHLTGAFTVIPVCPIATPGNVFGTMCIPGTLQIHRGFEQ